MAAKTKESGPGVGMKFLTEHYNLTDASADKSEFKNGHLFLVYLRNGRKIPATAQKIRKDWNYDLQRKKFRALLDKSLHFYKNLKREAEMNSFSKVSSLLNYFLQSRFKLFCNQH